MDKYEYIENLSKSIVLQAKLKAQAEARDDLDSAKWHQGIINKIVEKILEELSGPNQ